MTAQEMDILENWQARTWICAEDKVTLLEKAADDLTELVKSREGARAMRANYARLVEPMRKLCDVLVDVKPFGVVK